MKEATLTLTKQELGIFGLAMDALFLAERKEEHSKEYWEVFDELRCKMVEAKESLSK